MPRAHAFSPASGVPGARNIAIVAFDGVEILDVTGPMEVFAFANIGLQRAGFSDGPAYRIQLLAQASGPVRASCGLSIHAEQGYRDVAEGIDTLIVPGAPDVGCVLSDPSLTAWIRTMSTQVRRLVAICTGSFLLGEAGLLDGRRATSHWAYCDRLAVDYPAVILEPDRIFVRDGSVATSGGVTSGIDLALALVEEDWGRDVALDVARYLVVFLKRPGGQSQFSGYLVSEATHHPDCRALQLWIMEHPAEHLSIEVLAERMAMSPRNFARLFSAQTGMTPAKFVEKARIDVARQHLGETDLRIETVAAKSGFGDAERMRRAFIRQLGISPQDYRDRFARADPAPATAREPRSGTVASATLPQEFLPFGTRNAGIGNKWMVPRSRQG